MLKHQNFELNVSVSFGDLKIYIPKEWAIKNNTNSFLAKVPTDSNSTANDVKIILNGSVNFGEVHIIQI